MAVAMKTILCALGALVSTLPWCCIAPALVAVLGATGSSAAGAGFASPVARPLLQGLSLALLARAHYDVTWKRHGAAWAKGIVWASTAFVLVTWWFRL